MNLCFESHVGIPLSFTLYNLLQIFQKSLWKTRKAQNLTILEHSPATARESNLLVEVLKIKLLAIPSLVIPISWGKRRRKKAWSYIILCLKFVSGLKYLEKQKGGNIYWLLWTEHKILWLLNYKFNQYISPGW